MTAAKRASLVDAEPERSISQARDRYPRRQQDGVFDEGRAFFDGPLAGAAAESLATRDPVIASLLAQAGPPHLPRPRGPHFEALVRAIVYQQLAGAAAGAIYGRLVAALGGDVEPERLQALSDAEIRAVGLSRGKTASLRDLSSKVLNGTVSLSGRVLAPSRKAAEDDSRGRTMDSPGLHDVPTAPPRYLADGRPRRPARLWTWLGRSDAQRARAPTPRRAVPPIQNGHDLVVPEGRRALRPNKVRRAGQVANRSGRGEWLKAPLSARCPARRAAIQAGAEG